MELRDLSSHTAYEAGRGIEEVARDRGLDPDSLVKLASNENPIGPSPNAVTAITEWAPSIHTYPKASHADLVDRLAERWNVTPSQVWLANGGDGAIDYLSRATLDPGDRVLVPEPGFAYYAMSARYHHGTAAPYRLSKDENFAQRAGSILAAYDGERIVYVTSPHNPTGSVCSLAEIETIADETDEETLVVVDEAYGEFADVSSAVDLLSERDDVAVVRTFSKAYGLAGLRLGYAIVPEPWADAYARVNTPFAASEIACRAGLAALDDADHVAAAVETTQWARSYLSAHLDAQSWPSAGNFVLVDVGDATAVYEALLDQGIIVRDCTSFGLPECIRISCGGEEAMRRTVAACNEVLESQNEVHPE